ncbi:hypothetical protein CcCBS67573_g01628 [Chytriomyces confervae]|uniref:Beta-lactamase-related domain-containing protein n=1 Tax=Chytriomyces confervae TaxID=246404 RepID=A0A507FP58_9FUNG|nr:hypothetical protein HDU80_005538 [Chytriomyces hyalinus]TPX77116.1 hypothetical protein CcCBS67573_g01628 [Chytriomyces confervae]
MHKLRENIAPATGAYHQLQPQTKRKPFIATIAQLALALVGFATASFIVLHFALVASPTALPFLLPIDPIVTADWDSLKNSLDSLRKEWLVPGMAVAVVHQGELVFTHASGLRNENDAVTTDTLFQIGSTTKAFTSFSVAQLVDAGVLNWETPLTSQYPVEFMDTTANATANLIDALSHRTGLPRHDFIMLNGATSEENLSRIKYLQPSAPFREKFQYNNHMVNLAGTIGGKVSGLGWDQLVHKSILKPLGMDNTFTDPYDIFSREDHSRGHGIMPDGSGSLFMFEYNETLWIDSTKPAGAILSSVNDLAKWVALINNKGVNPADGKRFVSEKQFSTIFTKHTPGAQLMPVTGGVIKDVSYGLGWFMESYRGKACVEHGGNTVGYSTQITTFPEDSLAIIVLTNLNGTPLPEIAAQYISDVLLFPRSWSYWSTLWKSYLLKAYAQSLIERRRIVNSRNKDSVPSLPLAAYVGTYHNAGYGDFQIRLRTVETFDAVLVGHPGHTSVLELVLGHWEYDTFGVFEMRLQRYRDYTFPLIQLHFHLADQGGAVESLSAKLESSVDNIVFKRVD